MRRSALTVACSLLLPCAATAADGSLSAWRAYAQQAMSPQYAWAGGAVAPPGVLDSERARLVRETTDAVVAAMSPLGALSISTGLDAFGAATLQASLSAETLSSFTASYSAGTLVRPLSHDAAISFSAIVAQQRYATPGFGTELLVEAQPKIGVIRNGVHESSSGSGVRLAFDRKVNDALGWSLTMQSRLAMDDFKTYRGVYSESGDFDVPGFLQSGLRWSPLAGTELSVDLRRVFYSEVDAFTSTALPTRFLALLGDGASPEFEWRDLTVYSIEAARLTGNGGRWSLRYSSQQQPRPTSSLLDHALDELYSDLNLTLGFEQALGRFGQLRFAASYAPASYFFGTAPFVRQQFTGDSQYEFDAQWRLRF